MEKLEPRNGIHGRVYDLYAFSAITRRWLFWMMAVAIPLGLVTGAIEVVRYLAS